MCELEACTQFCNNNVNNFSSRFTKGKLRRGVIGSLSRWGNQVYVFHLSIFFDTVALSLNFLMCALSMWDTQVDSDSLSEILIL